MQIEKWVKLKIEEQTNSQKNSKSKVDSTVVTIAFDKQRPTITKIYSNFPFEF